jgi:hypothetical protein
MPAVGAYRGMYEPLVPQIIDLFSRGHKPQQIAAALREKSRAIYTQNYPNWTAPYDTMGGQMVSHILRRLGKLKDMDPKIQKINRLNVSWTPESNFMELETMRLGE